MCNDASAPRWLAKLAYKVRGMVDPWASCASQLQHVQVRLIQEARVRLQQAEKNANRIKAASKAPLSADQKQLRAQLEAGGPAVLFFTSRAVLLPVTQARLEPHKRCSLMHCCCADRRERAAQGPSQGSKAQALPMGGGTGNATSLRTLAPDEDVNGYQGGDGPPE